MNALERFVEWFRSHEFEDKNHMLPPGLRIQYHGRSDVHSQELGRRIVDDLLDACETLRLQAADGAVAFGINHRHTWSGGKSKTLDLAFGIPTVPRAKPLGIRIHGLKSPGKYNDRPDRSFVRLLIACEEKATMTEHGKSQPRIYSELNDSHTLVHQGTPDAIAAGISMVNIASSFISATRQSADRPVEYSTHDQPAVTRSLIQHLRGLPQRDTIHGVGLEAYCTFVVNVDNQGTTELHNEVPAPQLGDPDHYDTFIERIATAYTDRFRDLSSKPAENLQPAHEGLEEIACRYPEILVDVERSLNLQAPGADLLQSLIRRVLNENRD